MTMYGNSPRRQSNNKRRDASSDATAAAVSDENKASQQNTAAHAQTQSSCSIHLAAAAAAVDKVCHCSLRVCMHKHLQPPIHLPVVGSRYPTTVLLVYQPTKLVLCNNVSVPLSCSL